MMHWAWIECSVKQIPIQEFLTQMTQCGVTIRHLRRAEERLSFCCPARQYRMVAQTVHRLGGCSHVCCRKGFYFSLRRLLRRTGIWFGLAFFTIVLLWSQQFVWEIQFPGLDTVQRIQAKEVLRQEGITEGTHISEPLLIAGETALVQQQIGFGWASLNFEKGRLSVETAPAEPIPAIQTAESVDLTARVGGTITSVRVDAGTALVHVGDVVLPGTVLIAANRADRKGEPVIGQAAGCVMARFVWECQWDQPLEYTARQPKGKMQTFRNLQLVGKSWNLPKEPLSGMAVVRHEPLRWMGLPLPGCWTETNVIASEEVTGTMTETLAREKARRECIHQLYQAWPDAKICVEQGGYTAENGILHYHYKAEVEADIIVK